MARKSLSSDMKFLTENELIAQQIALEMQDDYDQMEIRERRIFGDPFDYEGDWCQEDLEERHGSVYSGSL